MEDRKPDYQEISEVYDRARPGDRPHVEWWIERLIEAGGLGPGKRLLDIGCGTGRWTIPLVEKSGCEAVGFDNSPGMLDKARAKDATGRIEWKEGDFYAPPVPQRHFDCALMSLILHHLEDPYCGFRAAYVALEPGRVLLIRQGTLDQIIDDPAHRFFPEAVDIELARTPLPGEVVRNLEKAGFTDIAAEPIRQKTHHTPQDLLVETENRVCSVMRMISDEAWRRGLEQMKAYIAENPDDPWLVEESMTLFVARRPGTSPG